MGGAYDSGLPFEDEGGTGSVEDVSPRVLARVDLEAGRVRPAWTLDAAGGWIAVKKGRARLELLADVRNLTNALRVINFAGVFSGTALAPPRSFAARARISF
jgi:hypothetical protein